MIEVSTWLLALLVEALAISLVVIIIVILLFFKHKKRDRAAVKKLVAQIKQQSKTRMETTSSFLNEKYRFEGDELKKAVKAVDKAEKKFIQHIIQVYVNRNSHALVSLDASMAEMIDAYKSLSPIMPDQTPPENPETLKELEQLKEANARLSEELRITKETMNNMINEFGNMFGGGKHHGLDEKEVVEKVIPREEINEPEEGIIVDIEDIGAATEITQHTGALRESDDAGADSSKTRPEKQSTDTVEPLDGIDLSDDK